MTQVMPQAVRQEPSLKLWLKLLRTTVSIEDQIRSRLRVQFRTTLPRFDVLAQLYRYPQGLTMGEVSKLLMVTKGNLTGLTDRLQAEGWIERRSHSKDGRSTVLQLTRVGKKEFEGMAQSHQQWVVQMLSNLTSSQQQDLFHLLCKVQTPACAQAQPEPPAQAQAQAS